MIQYSGKDDVPGDQDLKAGLIGAALGALGGGALDPATGATGALAAKGAALGTKAGAALGAKTAGAGLTGAKNSRRFKRSNKRCKNR